MMSPNIGLADAERKGVAQILTLTGLMEQHEKMAWMLRAFVTGASV
jgi:DNA-binding ferritin-like protein